MARDQGIRRIVAVAFEGETDPSLEPLVDEIVWLRVGQLGKMISAFTRRGIRQCVMLGQIAPKNLFDLRPDFRAMTLLFRLKEKNAHTVFGAVADELQKDGVKLIEATPWLRPIMPGPEFILGPQPGRSHRSDLEYAYRLAKEVSRLDIGQTVVVKDGAVLAVEGFEGTDPCLARGGQLAGPKGGAVAVKVAKADHDMRFDIPTVGLKTLETCAAHGVEVLALEAGRTLLLEREAVTRFMAGQRLTLTTVG